MELNHDITLEVASANNRRAKVWKNATLKWSEVVENLSKTTRTPETVAEYRKMGKDRQSDIKDVGGFVGGYCENGKRTRVLYRSILALDADFAETSLWDDWGLLYGCAAAIYSTHKHTPDKPRLRLVVPLSRPVDPDEFQAIGRRVAATLGMEQFDDTTYQPQRLMYWPSTSKDGEYVFNYLDEDFLNPDEVLATYRDWRDISSWPMSSRVTDITKRAAKQQQDPTEKDGIIGVFCRAYTIDDAIAEFVPSYAPCDDKGRYTFTEGSTAAGVTTYDGKFSYSFHATDPASGVLCNAWDLVRLHKFSQLDIDCTMDTPPGKRPSWSAMVKLAQNDTWVKHMLIADGAADFATPLSEDTDWEKRLKVSKDGAIASTIENIVLILNHDTGLAGSLVYDEFMHTIKTASALPWRTEKGAWTDSDDSSLRYYLERRYNVSGKDKIIDAVNVVAMEHRVHPIREYLDGLGWDGEKRVETLLVDYLGAQNTEYTRTVTRKTIVAAVARIYNPGCKFDYMLTLRGKQGIGKSAIFRKLGHGWYSDSFSTVQGKEAYEQTLGVWIVEVGELAGMRKAESEMVKLYISKQVDRFRPAYGRRTQEFPRQCIFIGTTNESQFLRDRTGNRRFWVVDTPGEPRLSLWDDMTAEVIDQIWAEAVSLYRSGESLYLSKELELSAQQVQQQFEEENPNIGLVAEYLDRLLPEDWEDKDLYDRRTWLDSNAQGTVKRNFVCAIEIASEVLGGSPGRIDPRQIKDVHNILSSIPGWKREPDKRKSYKIYGRQKYYERTDVL